MTEKQFFVTNGKHMVLEHEFYKGKNRLSPSQVIDLLNDLYEENQALKSDRTRYNEECRLDVFKELFEENEQLKQENRKLKEDLKHCANQFANDGKNVLLSLR